MPEAGAERLRAGFLCSEAAGIARRPIFAPVTFPAFNVGKNAIEKAVAETLDHLLDAADVDQIAAQAEDHRDSRAAGISRALAQPS
jgi:hypothetical protein